MELHSSKKQYQTNPKSLGCFSIMQIRISIELINV